MEAVGRDKGLTLSAPDEGDAATSPATMRPGQAPLGDERMQDQKEVLARRKPIPLLRPKGPSLMRKPARTFPGLSRCEPPRITRLASLPPVVHAEPSSGGATVVVVPSVRRPFPDVTQHVVQAEGISLE